MKLTLAAALLAAPFLQHDWSTWKGDGCRMAYPTDWTVREGAPMGAAAFFMAPVKDSLDSFRENVNLMVQPLNGATLDDYVRTTHQQIAELIEQGRLVSSSPSGDDGHEFEYTGLMNGANLHWKAVVRVKNDSAFLITYTAREERFGELLYLADAMMRSLSFTER